MKLAIAILATIALLILTIGIFVVYEVTVHPGSIQRQQVANTVWVITGLLIVAVWVWYFRARHGGKSR